MRTPKTPGEAKEKAHVHMLNSTLTATERTLCCLLENYQVRQGRQCVGLAIGHQRERQGCL